MQFCRFHLCENMNLIFWCFERTIAVVIGTINPGTINNAHYLWWSYTAKPGISLAQDLYLQSTVIPLWWDMSITLTLFCCRGKSCCCSTQLFCWNTVQFRFICAIYFPAYLKSLWQCVLSQISTVSWSWHVASRFLQAPCFEPRFWTTDRNSPSGSIQCHLRSILSVFAS